VIEYVKSEKGDGSLLAEIRALAMKPSLLKLGRYDETRVRARFLDNFTPENTYKIIQSEDLLGFYTLYTREDHHYLDHLYVNPQYQNKKIGSIVIGDLIKNAENDNLPLRLGALRGSPSNNFYIKNKFVKTHEDEFDIYYEYPSRNL